MTRHWSGATFLAASLLGRAWPNAADARGEVQSPTKAYVPFGTLSRMALAAENLCAARGYTVSAAVVDRDGVLRIALVGDDAAL